MVSSQSWVKVTENWSNNMAASYANLADVMQRSSATLSSAGVSLEQGIGLATSALEVLGDKPEQVGRSLNSLTQRLRGLSETGVDGYYGVSKLNTALEDMGKKYGQSISIFDNDGNLRNTFEILQDLSNIYPKMTENERQYIGEMAAGKTQIAAFNAILSNFDSAVDATDLALNSAGSAAQENAIFMESLEGKMNALNSAFSKFANESLNSGFIGSLLEATTGVLNFMTAIGGLPTVLMAVATAFAVLNMQSLKNFGSVMLQGVQILGTFVTTLISSKSATVAYATTQNALAIATSGATAATVALKAVMGGLITLGITAVIYGATKAFDALNVTVEEQTQKVTELKGVYDELQTTINDLESKEDKTASEEAYLDILKQQLEIQKQQLEMENQILAVKTVTGKGEWFSDGASGELESSMKQINEQIKIYNNAMDMANKNSDDPFQFQAHAKNATAAKERMMEFATQGISSYQEIMKYIDLLPEKEKVAAQSLLGDYDALMTSLQEYGIGQQNATTATESATEAVSNHSTVLNEMTDALDDLTQKADDTVEEINLLNSAIATQTAGMSLSASEVDKLLQKYPQLYNQVIQTKDGYVINTEALKTLQQQSANTFQTEINGSAAAMEQIIADCQKRIMGYKAELTALQQLQAAWGKTAQAKLNISGGMTGALDVTKGITGLENFVDSGIKDATNSIADATTEMNKALSALDNIHAQEKRVEIATGNLGNAISSASKKASSSKKEIKDYADEIAKLGTSITSAVKDLEAFKKGFDQFKKGYVNDAFKEQKMSIEDLEKGYVSAKKELENLTAQYNKLKNNTKGDEAKAQLDAINDKIKVQTDLISKMTSQAKEYNEALKSSALATLKAEQQGLNDILSQTITLIKHEKNLEKEKYQDLISDAKEANQIQLDALKERVENEKDAINEQLDALKESTEARKKLIKEEAEAQTKALKDELSKYQELINKRKELLDTQEEERDYQQQLAEKQNELLNLQQLYQEASGDDTLEGRTKKLKLEEEIAEKEKEIAELQHDWDISQQKAALDQMLEDKENQINDKIDSVEEGYEKEDEALDDKLDSEEKKLKEQLKYWESYLEQEEKSLEESLDKQVAQYQSYIDEIDSYLEKEGQIRKDAMQRIEDDGEALYDKLLEYNETYGTGINDDLVEAWNNAQDAMEKYGEAQEKVLSAMRKMDALEDYVNDGGGVTVDKDNDDKIQADGGSSKEEENKKKTLKEERANLQKYYHEQMQKAKKENNSGLIGWIKSERKKNQFDPDTGADLYKYHDGGVAGGDNEANLKSTEVFAKLMKGEPVVTENQAQKFLTKTLPNLLGSNSSNVTTSKGDTYNLELNTNGGAVDPSTYQKLYNDMKKLIEATNQNKAMFVNGQRRSAKSLSI